MKYLLPICVLAISFASLAKEHTIELTASKFDLILDKYFIRTIDFESLPETELFIKLTGIARLRPK